MNAWKWLFVAVLGVWVAGCKSVPPPPGVVAGPHGTIGYDVLVDSSPQGVRIMANGQEVGVTPLTLRIFGDKDGTFHDFGSYEYVVQALPNGTNQFLQTRVFRTGRMFTPQDRIPSRIFFDMHQPPVQYVVPGYPPTYYPPPGPYFYYYGPAYYHHYHPSRIHVRPPVHRHQYHHPQLHRR